MKKYAFLALCLMVLAGCGRSSPTPVTNSFGYGSPYYPGYYPGSGMGLLPPGVSRYQVPLYANGSPTFSGSQIQVSLGTINAGDQIIANFASLMLYKNCGNNWISFNVGYNVFPLQSPALAVNGTVIPNAYLGNIVAPAAGNLTLLATVSAYGGCTGNLSPSWSLVSGYGGYGSTPVAYINRCYNTATYTAVTCP